jgi:protein TonB
VIGHAFLRGTLIAVVSATHVAALSFIGARSVSAPPVPGLIQLDISLAPPEAPAAPQPTEPSAIAEPVVPEPPRPEPPPEPPELPVAEPLDLPLPPEPAPIDLAAAEPVPSAAPEPEAPPERVVESIAPQAPRVTPPAASPRRVERREPPRIERPRRPPETQRPPRASAASAPRESAGPDRAAAARSYAGLVLGAIRSRVVYPTGASGSGVAMVVFTVGASGRVSSASLSRSTGNPALDAAALSAVRGISVPPPPGGSFSAVAPIRFNAR